EENFLLLGGHSLLGAQLVIRVSDAFGVELGLRELFDDPTPRGIASRVRDLVLAEVSALDDESAARLVGP
ncbi:MAG: phosphopantetheine-binding protein, partial [Mycobacteriales bacterium]